ncbi:hypothetical protein A2661_03050 [Candidatus Giovannonibacteria bacterium RIFCSPHIGHO2_01_FULL_45_24]|uniref:Uncharacterized protein n=1 Tax=Candidatus Giovannonibacteria bacterium RIFCSPLOWO2_01_FULL_46_32 TaxID=1798353 RepID=A0A1F5XGK1_9BACT|nr:MAG: hypothetical protein A2661_03050 [Candidatus Giovannonibacteria bacterium RIFCSPHIGHO2_01_FULL_45_24]OGF86990.1 MAG: hypothetical protein A3B19_00970 [Candidatus Giovannonibacteria bacterium RIFCSPLOWO2_01_FULL_46_32]
MPISQDDNLFSTGEIFSVSDKKLDEILSRLAAEWNSPNLGTIILTRVLIINTIKQQRHIDKIECRNQIYTLIIIVLTIVSIVSSVIGIYPNLLWLQNRI